jgi:hypothetical protein
MTFLIKNNKVKLGKGWFNIIKKLNPEDYLDDNAKFLIEQIKKDISPISMTETATGEYDCFALFEGKVGTGKSNTANLFCLAMDETFTAERCIYRDWHYWRIKHTLTKNLNHDIDACRGKAINIDELRRILHAKDSLSPDAKAIEKDLGDIRALGLFIAACIDDVKSIMRYVRDTRIDLWFYCRKRGEVWVYKLYTTAKDDTTDERRMNLIKQQLLKGIHPYTPYKLKIKAIPKTSMFWIKFKQREMRYKGAAAESKENTKLIKLDEKYERLRANTITKTELCRRYHISRTKLWRLQKKKILLPIKTYKGELYKIADIDKLISLPRET